MSQDRGGLQCESHCNEYFVFYIHKEKMMSSIIVFKSLLC